MSLEYVEEWGLRVLILKCGSLCSWIELISVCCAFTFLFNFAWASHCWMFLPWSVFTFQYSLFFFLHDLFVVRLDDSCVCCVFHFFSCKLWLWNYNQLVAFAKKSLFELKYMNEFQFISRSINHISAYCSEIPLINILLIY